jgi:hypothetical protein
MGNGPSGTYLSTLYGQWTHPEANPKTNELPKQEANFDFQHEREARAVRTQTDDVLFFRFFCFY